MRALELSHQEYNTLWRRLQLGDMQLLLDIPDHGATYAERNSLDGQAWRRLQQRGIVDGPRVAPEVEDLFGTLARPALEADLRVRTPTGPAERVLACAAGLIGAVALLTPNGLTVEPVPPNDLARALLNTLPDHPPTQGNAFSVPAELVDRGGRLNGDQALAELEKAGLRWSDARQFIEWLKSRTVRVATIGTAARSRTGRRHRTPEVLTVFDAEAGRYLFRHQRTPHGATLLIAPGEQQRLAAEVELLVRSAADAVTRRR